MSLSKPTKIIVFVVIVVVVGLGYALLRETDIPAFIRVAVLFSLVLIYRSMFRKRNIEATSQTKVPESRTQLVVEHTPLIKEYPKQSKVQKPTDTEALDKDDFYNYTVTALLILMACCMAYALLDQLS